VTSRIRRGVQVRDVCTKGQSAEVLLARDGVTYCNKATVRGRHQ
jgi:hypothetical protein